MSLEISIEVDRTAYVQLSLYPPKQLKRKGSVNSRARKSTPDTGAQLTVINVSELHPLGIKSNSLLPVATRVSTVTSSAVDLLGLFVKISR